MQRNDRDISSDQVSVEYSPLMEAVENGDMGRVAALLAEGADVNYITSGEPECALTVAEAMGNDEIFFYLLQNGAELDFFYRDYEITTDPDGELQLFTIDEILTWALQGQSEAIVRYLVRKSGDLTLWTPTRYPSALDDPDIRAKICSWGIEPLNERIHELYDRKKSEGTANPK